MSAGIKPQTSNLKPHPRAGFTLTEILVVIGIIVLLVAITVPVVSKVRKSAQAAAVQAQINSLVAVIQQYQQDYAAYPGPIPHDQINVTPAVITTVSPQAASKGFFGTIDGTKITMSENMVLGLAGGLIRDTSGNIIYDPTLVGSGPNSLNVASPKKGRAYIDQTNLSWRDEGGLKTGQYKDGAGTAEDTIIPEILDTFPNPMPILYLRARKGQQNGTAPSAWTPINNLIVTDGTTNTANRVGQYDLSQIVAYVGTPAAPVTIGEGKTIDVNSYTGTKPPPSALRHGLTTTAPGVAGTAASMDKASPQYVYPYDAFPYLRDPSSTDATPQPRQKDGFILISAGLDRVYGTEDDITNFGPVTP